MQVTETLTDGLKREYKVVVSATDIVVQPHLLLHGQLIQDISALVAAIESQPQAAGKRWHIADHLGPAEDIVTALLARLQEVTP